MRKLSPFPLLAIVFFFAFNACEKSNNNSSSDLTQRVNNWIQEDMQIYYRWSDQMPNIDPAKESDPMAYFEKLLYKAEDKWSFITDDAQALLESLDGIETTFGYSLAFGIFSNTQNVFAVVEYVYPNTPAAEGGVQRGDIIIGIDGASLTLNNYTDVIYKPTGTMMMGVYDSSSGTIVQGGNVNLVARRLDLNPVHTAKVINAGGKKIGYLFYTQYISNYDETDLIPAFEHFQSQGVTDVVLDLRYNPGGAVSSAINLCSILAPSSVVQNKSVLMTMQWNTFLQSYWAMEDVLFLQNTFNKDVPVNMNLNSVYILTGSGSASATELTITGLDPYMNVVLIGDTTYGKYAASVTLQPEIERNNRWVPDPELSNWAIQPIVYTYANSAGVTNFKDGFPPHHVVKEDIIRNPTLLGYESEPLLAKAIELITGATPIASNNLPAERKNSFKYQIIDRRFSRFDQFKNTAIEKLNVRRVEK